MIGEIYFATRENLRRLWDGVFALSKKCPRKDALTEGQASQRKAMEAELTRPWVIFVCGEVNAGKSALLNALARESICKVDPLPQIGPVKWHKYGMQRREKPLVDGVIECTAPMRFLQCFELIDTPGTNSGEKQYLAAAARLGNEADLVLVIFPASNPWGAPTWDFLSRQPSAFVDKAIFLLQQCDRREDADIPVLLGHVRDLSMKRLGKTPPAFAIAAELAGTSHHKSSGMQSLEMHLSQRIQTSTQRKNALRAIHQFIAEELRGIEDSVDEQARSLAQKGQILDEIEREIDMMRAETLRNQTKSLGGIAEVFQYGVRNAAEILTKRLSTMRSITRLFRNEDTARDAEALIQPQLLNALEHVTGSDLNDLIERCCKHWSSLRSRLQIVVGVDFEDVSITHDRLTRSAEDFVQRMSKASARAISNLRLRGTLDMALRSRSSGMNLRASLTLVLITCAGLSGGMGWNWVAFGLLFSAAVSCVFLVHLAIQIRGEIVDEFGNRLLHQSASFVSAIRGDYEDGLRMFFRDYSHGLESIRKHLVIQNAATKPLMKEWNERFLELKAMEQEIG